MSRTSLGCRILIVLVALSSRAALAEDDRDTPASEQQFDQWIRELDDKSFAVREAASKNLLNAGKIVIEVLAKAASGDSAEVAARAIRILEQFSAFEDQITARAAKRALAKLAGSDRPSASRARKALQATMWHVASALERCSAQMIVQDNMIVAVSFDSAKALGANLRLLHDLPDLEILSFSTPLMDDDGLAELQGLPRLRDLNLYRSRVSDDGLKYLKTFPNLRRVPMGETQVTDKGLVHIKDLKQLEYVGLRGNQVTDAGLAELTQLTNLTGLNLAETKVTDAGLEHLKGLTSLRQIELGNTRVTPAGAAALGKVLPEAQINLTQP